MHQVGYLQPFTFDYENLHARVAPGGVRAVQSGQFGAHVPFPLRWLGVSLHYRKPDRPGTLYFGLVRDPQAALYNIDRLAFRYSTSPAFQVPPGDEPLFRAYFEVARFTDRPLV